MQRSKGTKQIQRQRKSPNLASDSSSCGSRVADEDSSSFKLGWRSSKQLFGSPMKKLLADEMLRETDSKKRSPSVIARLMGLDGMPAQQPSKQHKGSSENHLQLTTQVEKSRSRSSSRRSSKDQQEFKDVYEVSEMPKVESNRYTLQGSADMKLTGSEMSFIEQKFIDAKRLASDRSLQDSKEFDDTLEVLDSNTDLLLKYFQQPNSLFKMHLDDLQASPHGSHCGPREALQSLDTELCGHGEFGWKLDRSTPQLHNIRSPHKNDDVFPRHFDRRHSVRSSPKSSKFQLKLKDEADALPTRIVVLKPNHGKVQNATKIVSSACSSHTFLSEHEMPAGFPGVRNRDAEMHQKKNLTDTVKLSRQNSTESREIAKEVTRQMKNRLNSSSMILSSSRSNGFTGDNSPQSIFGNESHEESEVMHETLGNSHDFNNHRRPSSRSNESSVSREAKKRLSERWKMTHKSQDVQGISRSSTLAEMLAIPDKEMKGVTFDSISGGDFNDKISANDRPVGGVEPLGISSRDGWKDGCIGTLPRSISLPASSTVFGSPRTILRREALHDNRFMMPKEAYKRERKKAIKGFDHRQGLNRRSSKSGHRKSRSAHYTNIESDESSLDINTSQGKVKMNLQDVDSPKQDVLVSESLAGSERDVSAVTEDVAHPPSEDVTWSAEPPDVAIPESSCVLTRGVTGTVDEDNSMQQDLSIESSSGSSVSFQPLLPGHESTCCKDADQPSPVSVLEPSFTGDLTSCSECFESLSADLQGLRIQLQLLKLKSEECVEGTMLISSDEDGGEISSRISEDNGLSRTEDSWESTYIVEVLSVSGIDGAHPDISFDVWHSPECPVSHAVFDELEKRYSDLTTCSRSERRLLFDCINSGLVKIHQQSVDALPWGSPATTNVGSKLIKNGLEDGLCKLLGRQRNVRDDALGKVLVRELQWLELRVEIDVISREVERLLLDDLVAEIASK